MSIEAMKQVIELYDKHCYNNDYGGIEFNKNHGYKFIEAIEALRTAIQQAEAKTDEMVALDDAGDTKSKAWAWDGVCVALNKHWPQWSARPTNGAACATLAIADMAKAAATHPAPGVPDDVVRDAERYRWLRDEGRYNDFHVEQQTPGWMTTHSASSLDAAIDAAMTAAKEAK